MYFPEDLEEAAKYGSSAMQAMTDQDIPVNPNNYMTWYVHESGKYPDLSRSLDAILGQAETFTEERNAEIFDQYFGSNLTARALQETSEHIESAVTQLIGCLRDTRENTTQFGKALVSYSGELAQTDGNEVVRRIISNILGETKRMAEQHKTLQSNLSDSAREIADLKKDVQNIRREAMTDALTGVANRKSFDEGLHEAALQSTDTGSELALLLVDIDHFKKFNDTYGHQMGDEVLKLVAKTLTECVKGQDTVARYGGEEFAIILPRTQIGNAITLAEQIRNAVASRTVVNKKTGESLGHITLSIGVSSYRPREPLGNLIQRADAALYAGKRNGRNQVVSEGSGRKLSVV